MEFVLLILQLAVLFGAIFLGIRLGGMAIGYAGGFGVVILCLVLGMKPGDIPWDVILIIMSVIACWWARLYGASGRKNLAQESKIH